MMHGAYCKQCVVMHIKETFIFKYHLWQTVQTQIDATEHSV